MNIKSVLDLKEYKTSTFFNACDFTLKELLIKTRKEDVCIARQVGAVWMVLSGSTLQEAADAFNYGTHSAVFHALQRFGDCLDFPKSNL